MKLLAQYVDPDRQVQVFETLGDGSRLYLDDGALYTHVDAAGRNKLEYISAIEHFVRNSESVLLLGTAGGALASALTRRGVAVTAVDNWAPAFEIARRWFHLPASVECVHADAIDFLRANERRWSAVVVDVFRGVEIPDRMLTTETGTVLARAVAAEGQIVWNVADALDSGAVRCVSMALAQAGLQPLASSVLSPEVGNTLVVARATAERAGPIRRDLTGLLS